MARTVRQTSLAGQNICVTKAQSAGDGLTEAITRNHQRAGTVRRLAPVKGCPFRIRDDAPVGLGGMANARPGIATAIQRACQSWRATAAKESTARGGMVCPPLHKKLAFPAG